MKRMLATLAVVTVSLALVAPGGAVLATGPSSQPSAIDSCTVISEPGQYALTRDVVRSDGGDDACIEIRTSDVVVDGNGHVLVGNGGGTGIGTAGTASVRNVTITNLTVRENEYNVRLVGVTDGRISNVTSRDPDIVGAGLAVGQSAGIEIRDSDLGGYPHAAPAVRLRDSVGLTVANNTVTTGRGIAATHVDRSLVAGNSFEDVAHPVDFENGSGNAIANNTIDRRSEVGIVVDGRNNTIRGNAITLASDGIQVSGSENAIVNNDVNRIVGWAVSARGSNHTVVRNDLSGGEGVSGDGGALRLQGADHTVTANTLVGVHGVYIRNAAGSIDVSDNRLDAAYQLRVAETTRCSVAPAGAAAVEVRGNTFANDSMYYGVLNEDDATLDATDNYWGAASGPSSPEGTNVTDPVTGTVADGNGPPVSEGVHFDPWLRNRPANRTGA